MNYFHQEKNVEKYIQMAKGHDGQDLISDLIRYLPPDSSVLEIGMGPGTDLTLLDKYYRVTGSDISEIFLERYRKQNRDTTLILLDATSLETEKKYQGIYSNKVLMHLTREDLKKSIKRQAEILESRGIICHSFWFGDTEENYDGLLFVNYTTEQLQDLFQEFFDVIKIEMYQEMDPDDSLYIIAKKK